MYLGYNNRMSKRLCRRRRIRSYKTACSEKRAAKVSGDNNKYICQFFLLLPECGLYFYNVMELWNNIFPDLPVLFYSL